MTSPIPQDYGTVTPYLLIRDAAAAIEFYKAAFNGVETLRMPSPDGRVAHGEIKIGESMVMMAEEFPEMGFSGPQTLGGSSVSLLLYVDDVDELFAQAIDAGAEVLRPIENQFYGDRAGTLCDPYGHIWTIATHVEDLTPQQVVDRSKEFIDKQC